MSSTVESELRDEERQDAREGFLARVALRFASVIERWFPDAFIFALLAVALVAGAALAIGASPATVATNFSTGFWDLIPFTMQMAMVVVTGYIVASSPPAERLITRLAAIPRTARGGVTFIAVISLVTSMVNWGFGLVFAGLLARAMARRTELGLDYRAAGAAAYLGIGGIWALGLSSSAAQLQANPKSLTPELLAITGVIPFRDTIFLWQSLFLAAVIFVVSIVIAYLSAPHKANSVTAEDLGVDVHDAPPPLPKRERPGDWLEYSPVLPLIVGALVFGWLLREFASNDPILVISNLSTYNLLFLTLGMLLHWRPRRFLLAVKNAVPACASILVQFPFYAGIAAIMTRAQDADGNTVAHYISQGFVSVASHGTFGLVIGIYSAVLGLFIPSGGGKWIIEAPYVMQASNDLQAHLGWTVQIYNAAEALPNLVNPFWMLPLLGILGLRARHLVGFTAVQLVFHLPIVLGLLWFLGNTLTYTPPVQP
ncbi:short-chain fatty acid transporter [Rhodococcus sp. T2V]|uniref:short-chain fatty acid transporter n=1 Tax=Rhodococcus sp. T2V TaxID=3034164 RepID=UPI0023E1577A|nr:TIGR00366 family protein [Rhodococcus sp. T2V]MDF3309108.1 TIGR00366 family protein [Rhodococcus sp. T2V]